MVVYGTRPEAIKMAPLIQAIEGHPALHAVVAVTGQHREMLDQVNDLFGIVPEHDLDLMVHGATLADIASRALIATDRLVGEVRPDAVVVQGDTSTAFVAALASFYHHVPVIHLEAGLRSGDITSPFPEEANRRLTAPLTALHLAPTSTSRANLEHEGIHPDLIAVTGNTVIDALYAAVETEAEFSDPELGALVAGGDPFVLVTAHRRESWGEPMRAAMSGLRDAARDEAGVRWVLPMHRNPRVREVIEEILADEPNVHLTEPLVLPRVLPRDARSAAPAHRLRRRSGGGPELRQAGPGDAREHRATRGSRCGYGSAHRHRPRHRAQVPPGAAARPAAVRRDGQRREPLR